MCPQAGPGTPSYLAGDGIFVFLQVGDGFSNPHVDGAYDSVHIVGSIDAIGHPDQGIWGTRQGQLPSSSLGTPRQNPAHDGWEELLGPWQGSLVRDISAFPPLPRCTLVFLTLCSEATLCGKW